MSAALFPPPQADERTTDLQLSAAIRRCAAADRSALRLIFDLEAPRMIGVAIRILRRKELAEEAVQDAFMRIWRSAASFDPARGAARTWLYAVVRNQALTILHRERRFEADELDEAQPAEAAAATMRLPEASALRRCLQKLDDRRRTVLILAYVHGLSHSELARRLGIPLGTAKSLTRRGILALRECLA